MEKEFETDTHFIMTEVPITGFAVNKKAYIRRHKNCPRENTDLVVFLHGWGIGSCSRRWNWALNELASRNINALAIDFPGCGFAKGRKFKSKTKYMGDKQGPLDYLFQVLQQFEGKRLYLVGFSWGGGIAMKAVERNSRMFSKCFLFMPSIDLECIDLRSQTIPIKMLWVKEDQIHPYKLGEEIARKLNYPSLLEFLPIGIFNTSKPKEYYQAFADVIIDKLIKYFFPQ